MGVTTAREVLPQDSGIGPGRLRWLTWKEDQARYFSISHDGGLTWTRRLKYSDKLRLRDEYLLFDVPPDGYHLVFLHILGADFDS